MGAVGELEGTLLYRNMPVRETLRSWLVNRAPTRHLPHPPEIAGLMIRAYENIENPLVSLMLGWLLNPAISARGRFDGGSGAMERCVFLLEN